ncbi:protein-disulfide reductase DsbD family protein [Hydrogenophaga sp. OTU3427]|uniref:protein-disulfide reductase DsbD family protein n=1 Tax=Hydrogenophaga sp. OTU3427 TaxID=3043856 RepID=UPI00313BA050
MTAFLFSLLALAGALLGAPAAAQSASAVVRTEQVQAELLAHAPEGVAPGKPLWLGLKIQHAPHWHTYWKNPGDSGLPTTFEWKLPVGVAAGDIAWPTPKKFPIGHLANYGYEGTLLLPVPLTVSPGFQGRELEVKLDAAWLVCRKECIPEEGSFTLRLPVGAATATATQAFRDAAERAPRALAAKDSHVVPGDKTLAVTVSSLPPDWVGQTLEFFPETGAVIEPGAKWTQRWDGGTWRAEIPLSAQRADSPALMPVVLARTGDMAPGENTLGGLRVELPARGAWPALAALPGDGGVSPALQAALDANAARAAAAPPAGGSALSLGLALLGALVGGLLLNLMPCVFPVLAIKVLAFAQHADDRRGHRLAGLAYTAGVVLSFVALGALLVGLRAAGEQIGWGFQLQNPAVVAGLALLFTLIGLNLAGLFEFKQLVPGSLAMLQLRHPMADAFLTGVLAVAIASPCTAPFMGASLGLAVGLPTLQALAVFAAMGLGLALPYLAASLWPAVARALPRPGPWMNTLRQFMAFPMLATVVWLLWVLGQQTGTDGLAAALALLVALALVLWAWGRQGRTRQVLGTLSLAGLVALAWGLGPQVTRLAPLDTGSVAADASGWQAWSPARMAQWQAEGKPVFVDYTAAWCVTCQFNKKTVLTDAGLLGEMRTRGVVLARADWTRRDPAVTQALSALGRNGVPVYAIYRAGAAPVVLSELLSVNEVRSALARL